MLLYLGWPYLTVRKPYSYSRLWCRNIGRAKQAFLITICINTEPVWNFYPKLGWKNIASTSKGQCTAPARVDSTSIAEKTRRSSESHAHPCDTAPSKHSGPIGSWNHELDVQMISVANQHFHLHPNMLASHTSFCSRFYRNVYLPPSSFIPAGTPVSLHRLGFLLQQKHELSPRRYLRIVLVYLLQRHLRHHLLESCNK